MSDNAIKQTESDAVDAETATEPTLESVKTDKKKKSDIIAELKSKLEEKEQEAKENYDRFLRNAAELENYKKRTARQMDEFRKYANETLIMEILTIVDNLERAVHSSGNHENTSSSMLEGVQLTLNEILKILDKFGVKSIVALDQPFDPAFHQAVMQEETGEHPEQTVIKELQKGYLLHDRLLRPAMVVVSK